MGTTATTRYVRAFGPTLVGVMISLRLKDHNVLGVSFNSDDALLLYVTKAFVSRLALP